MAPEVILDPGHGGSQTYGGSSPLGVESEAGLAEKHVNLELAQRVAARLGSLAQLTRNGDVNVSLQERARMAARSGARVLVSLHANAGAYGTRGSEIWLHDAHDRRSAALAVALHDSLDRVGPTRGVFCGPLSVLDPRETGEVAACLVEADYLTDPQGRSRLTSSRGLDELADAISSGVRSYLGRSHSSYGADDGMSYDFTVPGTIPDLRQPSRMSCWATVATMLLSWRAGNRLEIESGMDSVGSRWGDLFRESLRNPNGGGLSAGDKSVFTSAAGLEAGPLANFGGRDWMDMLSRFGPLWVTADVNPNVGQFSIHARVLYRIHGDGSADNTTVWLIDPGTGTRRELTLGQFMREFEAEAAEGQPLRIQVLHWPESVARSVMASYRGHRQGGVRFGNVAASPVTSDGGLNRRYLQDQNIGQHPFHGYMRPRQDFTGRFIWLVWPQRRRSDDPPANVDVDVQIDLFDVDPYNNSSAVPISSQIERKRLAEGERFGWEFSRLPGNDADVFVRVTISPYSPQDANMLMWTQGYG